jgi:response regulator RpfG family c-di-GMP phosphodiesterase
LLLAQVLGITDQEEQDQIAVGAMLHDFGKRSLPSHLLTKPKERVRNKFRKLMIYSWHAILPGG